MNYRLSKEIYGCTPWLMDGHSFQAMTSLLSDIRKGVKLEIPEVKLNTPFVSFIGSDTKIITRPYGNDWAPGQLDNNDDFEAVGVIKIDGPITKSGGASSLGMTQVSGMMLKMSKDSRIKSFIVLTDSGGGSSSAVDIMVDTINEIKQSKQVIGLVEKGGMAASAAYGIISACNEVYCEDAMAIVGSVGTMIQFEGTAANKEIDGVKYIRLYATKSTKKNEAFEEALNNDNYSLLINDLLDPINEKFITMVGNNRPQLRTLEYDNGQTFFAKDVIGTFIDGIKSFDEVFQSLTNDIINPNINLNSKTMKKEELKSSNPELYQSIVSEGITQERERVKSWMAWKSVDLEAVSNGIESGEKISDSQREQFFIKQGSLKKVEALQSDSAGEILSPESKGIVELSKDKGVDASFDFELK